jgi:HlyD family secretion protein
MKRRILWSGIAAVVMLGILAASRRGGELPGPGMADGERRTARAQRGVLEIRVSAPGEIQARESHTIIPEVKRGTTISYMVEEGARVEQGDVVARLNTDEVESRIQDLETKLAQQQSALDNARTELEIQILDNQTARRTAEQNLDRARMEQEKFAQADAPLAIRNAEIELQTAESELTRKKNQYEDVKSLLPEGFVTEDEVEEARIAIDEERIRLETARIELDNLRKYDHPLKTVQYDTDVIEAETEMEKMGKQSQTLLRNKERAVETAQQSVERTARELEDAREEFRAMTVHAPVAGVIQYGAAGQPWRRTEIEVGSVIQRGQVLMTIPSAEGRRAAVNVKESDIRQVEKGQSALVTVSALSGRVVEGTVEQIAEVANPQNWIRSEIKDFQVVIDLVDAEGLKPGFSCQAEILTARIENALVVPVQAVFRERDEFVAHVVRDGRAVRTIVRPGPASRTHVQILDGLSEGEECLLFSLGESGQ